MGLHSRLRAPFLSGRQPLLEAAAAVTLMFAATMWSAGEARADCAPAAASNVTVACAGTTFNQGGGAPGTSAAGNGYGTGAESGVTVNVNPGATVTGTLRGIFFGGTAASTVTNAGAVAGQTAGFYGVALFGTDGGTVNNLSGGTITDAGGVRIANGAGSLTNAGSIAGTSTDVSALGVHFGLGGAVTNLAGGQITGFRAIQIDGATGSVTNAGAIKGTGAAGASGGLGVLLNTGGAVTNLAGGQITSVRGIQVTSGIGTVINAGTITGTDPGLFGGAVALFGGGTVTNLAGGVIAGGAFIQGGASALTNAGVIAGTAGGIFGGVGFFNGGTVTNLAGGLITGSPYGVRIAGGAAALTNAGTIIGTSGPAIWFAGGGPDTLTLLPGSKIIGAITLAGVNDTVNVSAGNQNLTVNTLAGASVVSTLPFVASGNRIVTVDPTPFAVAGTVLNDFARGVSGMLPSFDDAPAAAGGAGPLAFAAPDNVARLDEAFAGIPGLAAYAPDKMVFKNANVTYADGSAVWTRGFAGEHRQQADGLLLRSVNSYYGGAVGADRQVWPNLRLGAFAGAGSTRSSIDPTSDSTDGNLIFGGAYARYAMGASFLNAAVQGGGLRNTTVRSINNNLAVNGLETATAAYNGWYLSPELMAGHRFALGRLADSHYALTPSLQVRYLYGAFGGYTETGSSANLTVNGWSTQNLEERAELKLTRSTQLSPSSQLLINLAGGGLAVQRVGGSGVNAALLGQPMPFSIPGSADVWGGFGGLGLEWRSLNVAVFASGEYLALTNSSSIASAKGGVRVSF